jgi:ribosomal protein S18 acetylase RimI-like enzyme
MTENIRVRPAGRDDLEAVRGLLVVTWHDTYDPLLGGEKVEAITNAWHAVEVLAQQLDGTETSFLVAESADGIVGHAFADARRPPVLLLARLYVLPAQQRRGIGTQLLAAAIVRHPNLTLLRLNVETDNAKAVQFYRRQGFNVIGRTADEGIETLQMERVLR